MMILTKPCVRNTKSSSLDSGSDAALKWRRKKATCYFMIKECALLFKTKRLTSDLSLWPARALWAAEAALIFSFSQKFLLRISHLPISIEKWNLCFSAKPRHKFIGQGWIYRARPARVPLQRGHVAVLLGSHDPLRQKTSQEVRLQRGILIFPKKNLKGEYRKWVKYLMLLVFPVGPFPSKYVWFLLGS